MVVLEITTCVSLAVELIKFLHDNYDAFKHAKKRSKELKITVAVVQETLMRSQLLLTKLGNRVGVDVLKTSLAEACEILRNVLESTLALMKVAAQTSGFKWVAWSGNEFRKAMVKLQKDLMDRDSLLRGTLNNFIEDYNKSLHSQATGKDSKGPNSVPAVPLAAVPHVDVPTRILQETKDDPDDEDVLLDSLSEEDRKRFEEISKELETIKNKKMLWIDLVQLRMLLEPYLKKELKLYQEVVGEFQKTTPSLQSFLEGALSSVLSTSSVLKEIKEAAYSGDLARFQLLAPSVELNNVATEAMILRRQRWLRLADMEQSLLSRTERVTLLIDTLQRNSAVQHISRNLDLTHGHGLLLNLQTIVRDLHQRRNRLISHQENAFVLNEDDKVSSWLSPDAKKLEEIVNQFISDRFPEDCVEFVASLNTTVDSLEMELSSNAVELSLKQVATSLLGGESDVDQQTKKLQAMLKTGMTVERILQDTSRQLNNSKKLKNTTSRRIE